MSKSTGMTAAHGVQKTKQVAKIDPQQSAAAKQEFVSAVLAMSWQLALVVLVPVIGGAELDKALHTQSLYVFIGLAVAVVGSVAVMWRAMQAANRLPVPKLTPAQKQAIRKSYEEDDND